MRRALAALGLALLVLGLVVGGALARQAWLTRERDELLRREAVRAPVSHPDARRTVAWMLPPSQAACLTGVVLRNGQPVAGAAVSAAATSPEVPGCPCAAGQGACRCPAGLQWLLEGLAPGLGLVEATGSAVSGEQGQFALCGPGGARLVWAEAPQGWLSAPAVARPGEAPLVLELRAAASLLGRVEDEAHQPIPGAQVLALATPPVASARTEAGPDGRFQLLRPGGEEGRLVVGAPGFAPRSVPVPVDGHPAVVVLSRPARVSVQVLHEGARVSRAQVTLAGAEATAGSDGVADFAEAPRHPYLELEARRGTLVGQARLAVAEAERRAFVEVEEGAVVSGRLAAPDGRPLEEASVQLSGRMTVQAQASADGRFAFRPVLPGSYELTATAPGCQVPRGQERTFGAGAAQVELALQCEPAAEGQLVDARGVGVKGQEVVFTCGDVRQAELTDALGHFRAFLPGGECTLKVGQGAYRPVVKRLTLPARGLRLVLDAGASVAGVVKDRRGQPVPGVEVVISPVLFSELLGGDEGPVGKTDPAGRFMVSALKPGRVRVLAASGRGAGRSGELLVEPGAAVEGVEVVLAGLEAVSGTVRDARGHPVTGALVRLMPRDEEAELTRALGALARGDLLPVLAAMSTDTRTDLEGAFSLEPPTTSAAQLRVSAPGYKDQEREAQPGARVELVLEAQEGRRIQGRVMDARGPLSAFTVDGEARAAPDGRFSLRLRPGATEVSFSAPGHARVSRPLVEAEDLGDVELPLAAGLSVAVKDEAGAPLPGVSLGARQGPAGSSGTTGPDGVGLLKGLAAGAATLEVGGRGRVPETRELTLGAEPTRVEVALRAARGAVVGLVRGPEGPAAEVAVRVGRYDRTETRTDGTFRVEGLVPGAYPVLVRAGGAGQGVRVAVDQAPVTVAFELRGALLEGEARMGGAPLLGGMVVATPEGSPPLSGEDLLEPGPELLTHVPRAAWATVDQGRYALPGLPPGRWALTLVGPMDLAVKQLAPGQVVELGQGERRRVDLDR
jgi:hypothetical protein